jgi:predicted phosphodiesterase
VAVAALYDIHGNAPALEAVIAEIANDGQIDEIVVGGDVLWGPLQSDCLSLLRGVGATCVAGNCERDVLHPRSEVDTWCSSRLAAAEREYVESWGLSVLRHIEGLGQVVFCHATPADDEQILTRLTPDDAVASALDDVEAAVVVCGHTHSQFDRRAPGAPRLVNAGSVGLPYEGARGAYWARLGMEGVQLRRTAYDVDVAIELLRETGFPRFEDVFGRSLRGELGPDEAARSFESRRGA